MGERDGALRLALQGLLPRRRWRAARAARAADSVRQVARGRARAAAGDAMGVAHLFAYPANEPGAGSTDIAAHVGAIGALAFTGAGALLTAGSADGAILEGNGARADRARREYAGEGEIGVSAGASGRDHTMEPRSEAGSGGGRTGVEVLARKGASERGTSTASAAAAVPRRGQSRA